MLMLSQQVVNSFIITRKSLALFPNVVTAKLSCLGYVCILFRVFLLYKLCIKFCLAMMNSINDT